MQPASMGRLPRNSLADEYVRTACPAVLRSRDEATRLDSSSSITWTTMEADPDSSSALMSANSVIKAPGVPAIRRFSWQHSRWWLDNPTGAYGTGPVLAASKVAGPGETCHKRL